MKKILACFVLLFVFTWGYTQTTERWTSGIGSVTSGSSAAIATDLIGNVYTAGTVSGTGGTDWEIISYLPDGTTRWTMTLNGSGSGADAATGIAVDSAFNIYVCGYTVNSSSNEDITVRKIDSAGATLWTTNYSRSGTANDRANAIVVKGSSVYITGKSENASSNYDCAILKLAVSDGSVTWASFYNGTGSGLDVGNAIVVNNSGDVYVTGSTVSTSTGTDGLILKYASNGTNSWNKTQGGSGTDELFSIALDASGNVYITGYKTVTGGATTDYITAKINSGGTTQWGATYNGSFSGDDKAKALVLDASGYVYVTGSSESASANKDYLTICYSPAGSASWTQRYNGPGNADDHAVALLIDGTDIVITGSSKNSSGDFDFTTLSYVCSGGTLSWTMRTDGSGNGADMCSGICRDEMGAISICGTTQIAATTYEMSTVSYFQKTKNDDAITNNLMMLSGGLVGVYDSSSVRALLFDMITLSADCVWVARYTDFVANGDASGLNMSSRINSQISSTYSLDTNYNWISILTKQLWDNDQKIENLIGVPYFNTFTYSTFISTQPKVAYNYIAGNYPIDCINCGGQLSSSQAQSTVSWLNLVAVLSPFAMSKGPNYSSCISSSAASSSSPPLVFPTDFCQVCPSASIGTLTNMNSAGTGSHEIGIDLLFGNTPAPCSNILDLNPYDQWAGFSSSEYANISAVGGIYWLRTDLTGLHKVITKTANPPIIDLGYYGDTAPYSNTLNYVYSNSMSLCAPANYFTAVGSYTERFSLYYGLYRVSRPGIFGMPPIYFAFNYAKGITFPVSPDMNIFYGATQSGSQCSPTNKAQMVPNIFVENSLFEDEMNRTLGLSPAMDYLVTTNYSTLINFWDDNVITVGFGNNGIGIDCDNNVLTFYADNTGSTCSPGVYTGLTQVGQLSLSSAGEYDFQNSFYSSVAYIPGTVLTVHVIAQFVNGESIDQCQTITLVNPASGTDLDVICALIRGNISNYASSPISYQVDIYN